MAEQRTRVPRKDSEFDQYITGSRAHLLTQPAPVPVSVPPSGTVNILELDETFADGTPITTAPDASFTPLEGAKIRQHLRVDEDASRASIHPLSDAWERVYKIGSPAPANPAACPLKDVGSKALTTFNAGMDNDGKKLYAFFRWINMSNPANNGPTAPW